MTRTISIVALLLAPAGIAQAQNQPVCMQASEMKATLIDMYGEYPQPGAVRTDTSVTQLWASPETGTWTMVKYLADGTACAIDDGDDFEDSPRVAALQAGFDN